MHTSKCIACLCASFASDLFCCDHKIPIPIFLFHLSAKCRLAAHKKKKNTKTTNCLKWLQRRHSSGHWPYFHQQGHTNSVLACRRSPRCRSSTPAAVVFFFKFKFIYPSGFWCGHKLKCCWELYCVVLFFRISIRKQKKFNLIIKNSVVDILIIDSHHIDNW